MPIPFNPRTWVAALLVLFAVPALAICPPPIFAGHIRVGADPVHCQAYDIQSAINLAGICAVIIDITRDNSYIHQHLTIDNKPNITLQGWGDGVTCADIPNGDPFGTPYTPPASTQPLVTLDGSNGGRVLTITGNSNVGLRNLTVTGGQTDDSASGGGISFDGQGSLYLTNSLVNLNHGGYGAGINVNGSSGPTSLTLGEYTQILVNTAAVSGGGVRMEGNSRLYALKPYTWIGFNHAPNGYGGGIEVLGPARADIGSPGYNGTPVIYANDAAYGGGIDILNFNDNGADALVRLFTTDPKNPVQISSNSASHTGGAIYLKPKYGFGRSILCAYDFRINNNVAQEGTAIYSDADYGFIKEYPDGGYVFLNTNQGSDCTYPESPPALGAVACKAGVPCNEFVGNTARNESGQPTGGSTILLQTSSLFEGDRFSARQNTGAHVLRELGDGLVTSATLTNCLLVDNTLTQELIALTDGDNAFLTLNSCTVAGNTIGAPFVFLAPGSYGTLYNSIIDQPGRATVDPTITDGTRVQYLLTNDRSTVPDTVYIQAGEPSFVDAAHGDYHLLHSSLGVDDAPVDSTVPPLDLDRKPRVVDLPDVPNRLGPRDLGAYEIQPACSGADTIFCNGFE